MKTFRETMGRWPIEGMALHGTPYRNVESIRREGLTMGYPFVAPLPHLGIQEPTELKEYLERLIGSIHYVRDYANKRLWPLTPGKELEVDEGDLPAIVIFRGRMPFEFTAGDDADILRRVRLFSKTGFRSHGKTTAHVVPEHYAGHVRITPEEYADLVRRSLKQPADVRRLDPAERLNQLITAKLLSKTLAALRRVVRLYDQH